MTYYTVLAYRENGYTRDETTDSAFEFKVFTDPEEAAKYWAKKDFESFKSDRGYSSWDLEYLINGSDGYNDDLEDIWVDIKDLSKPYLAELHKKDEAERDAKIAEHKAKADAKAKSEADAREAAELAIFYKVQKRLDEQSHVKS